jgi:hypothetical protein
MSNPILLDTNFVGNTSFQLPSGSSNNSYLISLYVHISDDSNDYTKYLVPQLLIVKPNSKIVNDLINELIIGNYQSVMKSNLSDISKVITSLVAMIHQNVTNTVFYLQYIL